MKLFKRQELEHITEEAMSCYMDGELSWVEKSATETHFDVCSDCRFVYNGLLETVSLIRQMEMIPVPRSFSLNEAETKVGRVLFISPSVLRVGFAATAAALILVIAGDLAGIMRDSVNQTPVQVGMAERGILITAGSLPTPEQPLIADKNLSEASKVAGDGVVADKPFGDTATDMLPTERNETRVTWWHVILGLVAGGLLIGAFSKAATAIIPRR